MGALPPVHLLIVCTANQCRSPLGEVIARDALTVRRGAGTVVSAGTQADVGSPATPPTVDAARRRHLDLRGHTSRPVHGELVRWADLTIGMTTHHVLDLVTNHRSTFETTFTLVELARLAGAADPRRADEDLTGWLARISAERSPGAVLAQTAGRADIADPTGGSGRRHRRTATQIADAFDTTFDALFGPPLRRR